MHMGSMPGYKVLHANGEEGISLSQVIKGGILISTRTFVPKSLSTLENPALNFFVDLIHRYTKTSL